MSGARVNRGLILEYIELTLHFINKNVRALVVPVGNCTTTCGQNLSFRFTLNALHVQILIFIYYF